SWMNTRKLQSIIRDRSSHQVARLIAGTAWLSLVVSTVPSMSQTCPQVVQQIRQLNKDLQSVSGCPAPTVGSARIPTVLSPGGKPTTPNCVPKTQAIDPWWSSHKPEYDALTSKLAACVAQACPPIQPVRNQLC